MQNLDKICSPYSFFNYIMFDTAFVDFNNNEIAFVHLKQQITPYFSGKIHSKNVWASYIHALKYLFFTYF